MDFGPTVQLDQEIRHTKIISLHRKCGCQDIQWLQQIEAWLGHRSRLN